MSKKRNTENELKVGRPSLPAKEQTKPRAVRLNDVRWIKLKKLGREWLENMIDEASLKRRKGAA